jgi:hypothetical protein
VCDNRVGRERRKGHDQTGSRPVTWAEASYSVDGHVVRNHVDGTRATSPASANCISNSSPGPNIDGTPD